MNRLLFLLWALPLPAQLALFTVTNGVEQPAPATVSLGTTVSGETMRLRLRLRSTSSNPVPLTVLTVTGTGFTLDGQPTLPFSLGPNLATDFFVTFQTESYGTGQRGTLRFNTSSVALEATATAAARLQVEDGGRLQTWNTSNTVNFGQAAANTAISKRFVLANPHPIPVTVTSIDLLNGAYRLGAPVGLPRRLDPSQSFEFTVVFAPAQSGQYDGALLVDQRRFVLAGAGTDASPARPSVVLESASLGSAKQAKASVRLAAPAGSAGAGRLRIEFDPLTSGPDDPAIQFLSTRSRTVPFTYQAGDSQGSFSGGSKDTVFQTGTTAGKIRVIAELGGYTDQVAATVAPGKVVVDSQQGTRRGDGLEINLAGYDNSRSAGPMRFTFYDRNGNPLSVGAIQVDVGADFRRYFAGSNYGGLFALKAVFPVNSGSPAEISAVEIEMTNNTGTAAPVRVTF